MTSNDRLRFDASSHSSSVARHDDFLRSSIAYHLQNFCLETDTFGSLQAAANAPRVAGAIFLSVKPAQLRLLIADARTSIVLAIQRHLGNERYKKRLRAESHYRALRPHLSAGFRVLMMPQSNWSGYRFSESRKPNLVLAYQAEIERLEMELSMAPGKIGSHVLSRR